MSACVLQMRMLLNYKKKDKIFRAEKKVFIKKWKCKLGKKFYKMDWWMVERSLLMERKSKTWISHAREKESGHIRNWEQEEFGKGRLDSGVCKGCPHHLPLKLKHGLGLLTQLVLKCLWNTHKNERYIHTFFMHVTFIQLQMQNKFTDKIQTILYRQFYHLNLYWMWSFFTTKIRHLHERNIGHRLPHTHVHVCA